MNWIDELPRIRSLWMLSWSSVATNPSCQLASSRRRPPLGRPAIAQWRLRRRPPLGGATVPQHRTPWRRSPLRWATVAPNGHRVATGAYRNVCNVSTDSQLRQQRQILSQVAVWARKQTECQVALDDLTRLRVELRNVLNALRRRSFICWDSCPGTRSGFFSKLTDTS
jgi:hypothetical protein